MTKFISQSTLILLLALAFSSCVSSANNDDSASPKNNQKELQLTPQESTNATADEKEKVIAQMKNIAADLSCTTNDQCASMPVGNSSCGGPSSFLVYSNAIGDHSIKRLQQLSETSKILDLRMQKMSQESGGLMMGICRHIIPSDLACIDQVCKELPSQIIR